MRRTATPRRTALVALLCAVVALVAGWGAAGPAWAHSDLAASTPAADDVVEGPLTEVVLTFTQAVDASSDSFAVLGGDGQERTPTVEPGGDGSTYALVLDPPVAPGQVAVRWSVRAADGHTLDGGIAFTVRPAAADATGATGADGDPEEAGGGEVVADEGAALEAVEPEGADDPAADVAGTGSGADDAAVAAFLADGDGGGADEAVATAGRMLALAGGLVAVGALVVATWALRGDRRDVRHAVVWIRRAALVAALGGVVEVVGAWLVHEGFVGAVGAALLRLVAALAVVAGLRDATVADPAGAQPSEARVAGGGGTAIAQRSDPDLRLDLGRSPVAVVGAVALLVSLAFDGHTVTAGVRPVTAVVDVVHAAAGAVWVGGVVLVALLLADRRRRGVPSRATELGARLSVAATIAIVVVALAGVALTVTIADEPADLWSTAWGRLLLVKVALVAVAAALGAHNHRVLVPALAAGEDGAGARFARVLAVEAVVLVAVLAVTAWLVAASTVG